MTDVREITRSPDLPEVGDQFLGYPVGEVILRRIAGQVFQGQHRKGANRRRRASPRMEKPQERERERQRRARAIELPCTRSRRRGRRRVGLDETKRRWVRSYGKLGRHRLRTLVFDDRDVGEKSVTAAGDGLDESGILAESPNACRILLIALLRP